MNILVIGNGFDLAHGLPTGYIDFLEFCKRVRRIYTYDSSASGKYYETENLDNWEMNEYVKERLKCAYNSRLAKKVAEDDERVHMEIVTTDKILDELYSYIDNNTWIEYFFECSSYVGENWIDFESEISRVIQALDAGKFQLEHDSSVMSVDRNESQILTAILKAARTNLKSVYGDVKALEKFASILNVELQKMTRALEIYISEFVGKIEIGSKSVDIADINPDYIVSFNYSNTYERVYEKGDAVTCDYIHGRADIKNTLESNNMVLGIDEYLSDDVKDKEIEFIAFKKYYQRIHKQCRRLTEGWCADIKREAEYAKNSRKFMLEEQIEYELANGESVSQFTWRNYEKLAKD